MSNYYCNDFNTWYSGCPFSPYTIPQEDRTLVTLQQTNNELKHLINKLDNLSSSIDMNVTSRAHMSRHFEHENPVIIQNHYIVDHRRRSPNTFSHIYNRSLIDLDDISYLRELENIKKDANIYPIEYYRREPIHYEDCYNIKNERRRSLSRNRSQERPTTIYTMNVIKPKWNGGPFSTNYNWRDDKLKKAGL